MADAQPTLILPDAQPIELDEYMEKYWLENKSEFVKFKYGEGKTIKELEQYIKSTYDQHYSKNKYQATEFIIDAGHGEGFCIGNIMKYAQRYGKKEGRNRKDILKILHYGMILLHVHDKELASK